VDRGALERALDPLRGVISQKPPAYSAKKVRGEAAHRRARRGESVDLPPVAVEVRVLEVTRVDLPEIDLQVECSSGTYIRSLARDLGRGLGVGGHLVVLRRTGIGPFSSREAVPLDDMDSPGDIEQHLIDPGRALGHLPGLEVGPDEVVSVRRGQTLPLPFTEIPSGTPVRVMADGHLVAVAYREGDRLQPRKVFGHG
jgi:tRNA pseudouridine55 synthase